MIIKKELIKREIVGDTILVPLGKSVYESNGLFVLNELGAFIWNLMPAVDTEEEIVDKILEEYEVSREEAEADTAQFMAKLREMNIID